LAVLRFLLRFFTLALRGRIGILRAAPFFWHPRRDRRSAW
jgi:hypothetical protein